MNNITEINPNPAPKPVSIAEGIFDFLEAFVLSVCAVVLIFTFAMRLARVDGPSMENTLFNSEKLIISNLFYEPKRGDIVVFHELSATLTEPVVKRVIALGGDTVDIDFSTWTVRVNGEVIDEPYITLASDNLITSSYTYPLTVPEGHLFVMGDNRNHSLDSRNSLLGPVDVRKVMGRVVGSDRELYIAAAIIAVTFVSVCIVNSAISRRKSKKMNQETDG